jgi:hypothetical protein
MEIGNIAAGVIPFTKNRIRTMAKTTPNSSSTRVKTGKNSSLIELIAWFFCPADRKLFGARGLSAFCFLTYLARL